jgi:hypothetical protein
MSSGKFAEGNIFFSHPAKSLEVRGRLCRGVLADPFYHHGFRDAYFEGIIFDFRKGVW